MLLHHRLRLYRWRLLATAPERRSWYYDWLLTARQTAAEMRLLDLGAHFQSAYEAVRSQLRGERRKLARDQGLAEAAASACGLLVTAGAALWMVWRTTQQQTSLGDLALFFQAFNQGQGLAGSLLASVGEAYSNSLFLGDLFEFLALDRKVVEQERARPAPSPLQQGIVLDQVGFRYPGSQRAALRDFSLAIPAGRITAVVGRNGAGKSTLVKLLCRLYDPDAGSVQIDGVDLRQMRVREVRRLVTVLMQEPVQYSATVAENIALGDLAASPGAAAIANAIARGRGRRDRRSPARGPRHLARQVVRRRHRPERRASGSASPWRARSSAAPRSSFSTSRPAPWTPGPRPTGWRGSARWPRDGPPSSSPIVSPPPCTPTAFT